jgi:hypothetical protein
MASSRLRWGGYVAGTGEMRTVYRIRPLEDRGDWTGYGDGRLMELARDCVQCWALIPAELNVPVVLLESKLVVKKEERLCAGNFCMERVNYKR